VGGPYSDIVPAREERIVGVRPGARVVHEVLDLHPETEYTIHVSVLLPDGGRWLEERLEARTADSTTALFAGEDWGRQGGGKADAKDGDYMKDPTKPSEKEGKGSSGASSSWMSSPGASSSAAAAAPSDSQANVQVGRTDSQDDVSTNAPSEAGDEAAARRQFDDNVSEWGSEACAPGAESTPRTQAEASSSAAAPALATALETLAERPADEEEIHIVQEINVIEVTPAMKRSIECKFCSWMSCFKPSFKNTDEDDIVIERKKAASPKIEPKAKRRFRPYRPAFPGVPVDPRSVGLAPGPGDLV
jgi:hypothetical protein